MWWGILTTGWWIYLIVMLVAKLFEVETIIEGFIAIVVVMILAALPSAFMPKDL